MEEVKEFKYLRAVLCRHGEMEEKIRERVVKRSCIILSLAMIMRERNIFMEVKKVLRNSILLPTLTYGSD